MTDTEPKIVLLNPVVLDDNRRVTLELVVEGLPPLVPNVMFADKPDKPDFNTPSPYPNIELSILNSQRQQVASLLIIEHKEKHTALTLHLRNPDPQTQYIARAEMVITAPGEDKVLDVVEVPFTLRQEHRHG